MTGKGRCEASAADNKHLAAELLSGLFTTASRISHDEAKPAASAGKEAGPAVPRSALAQRVDSTRAEVCSHFKNLEVEATKEAAAATAGAFDEVHNTLAGLRAKTFTSTKTLVDSVNGICQRNMDVINETTNKKPFAKLGIQPEAGLNIASHLARKKVGTHHQAAIHTDVVVAVPLQRRRSRIMRRLHPPVNDIRQRSTTCCSVRGHHSTCPPTPRHLTTVTMSASRVACLVYHCRPSTRGTSVVIKDYTHPLPFLCHHRACPAARGTGRPP